MSLRAKSKYVIEARPAPRAGVTLFCTSGDLGSLWARIVLAEKDVEGARIEWITPGKPNHDLMVLNPAQTMPTLVDRDTVIHPAQVIVEYLDERYPHPRLLPVDPAARARLRMTMLRFEQELFPWAQTALAGKGPEHRAARKALNDALLASARLFPMRGWFLGLDFNVADCAWAALFSQIQRLDLRLTGDAQNLLKYAQRLFTRPSVQGILREQQ